MSRTHRVWLVVLVLAIAALYTGIVLALSPYHGFWSGDAGVKLWQMEAWIASGWRTPWAAYAAVNAALDPDHRLSPLAPPFAVWEGDRVLTIYTLPYTFASSLLLAKWGRLALYAPPLAAGVAGLVLVAWMGHRFSARVAWLALPVLGLATPWLFYSVVFWEHTTASVFVWAALGLQFLDADALRVRWARSVAAGLCLGAAVAARPEAAVCALALVGVLVVRRSTWRPLGWLMGGLALAGLVGYVYQTSLVGWTLRGQVTMNFDPSGFETPLFSAERLIEMSQMVVQSCHPGVRVILAGGVAIFALARVHRRLHPADTREFGLAIECAGLGLVAVGAVVLLLRDHQPIDLFTGVPVVCLSALGRPRRVRAVESRTRWKGQLAVWCVLVVGLSIALGRQNGGWQWGPRYLTPLLAPLVLLSLEHWQRVERAALSHLGRGALWAALAALALAGVITQGVGVVRLWQVRSGNDALARALLRPPPAVVVTDIWFVPQIAPQVYGQAPLLLVRTADEWRELDGRLAGQDVSRVRVVRLTGPKTLLAENVAARWRLLADTAIQVPTVPPLIVADYVPREP